MRVPKLDVLEFSIALNHHAKKVVQATQHNKVSITSVKNVNSLPYLATFYPQEGNERSFWSNGAGIDHIEIAAFNIQEPHVHGGSAKSGIANSPLPIGPSLVCCHV